MWTYFRYLFIMMLMTALLNGCAEQSQTLAEIPAKVTPTNQYHYVGGYNTRVSLDKLSRAMSAKPINMNDVGSILSEIQQITAADEFECLKQSVEILGPYGPFGLPWGNVCEQNGYTPNAAWNVCLTCMQAKGYGVSP